MVGPGGSWWERLGFLGEVLCRGVRCRGAGREGWGARRGTGQEKQGGGEKGAAATQDALVHLGQAREGKVGGARMQQARPGALGQRGLSCGGAGGRTGQPPESVRAGYPSRLGSSSPPCRRFGRTLACRRPWRSVAATPSRWGAGPVRRGAGREVPERPGPEASAAAGGDGRATGAAWHCPGLSCGEQGACVSPGGECLATDTSPCWVINVSAWRGITPGAAAGRQTMGAFCFLAGPSLLPP